MNPIEMMNPTSNTIQGLVVAIVKSNQDEEGEGRIRIAYPWKTENQTYLARVVSFIAGKDKGAFFLPEVGDEVLVGFEQGNIESPIILGALWSSKDKPPVNNSDGDNNIKKLKTNSGNTITFDDAKGKITIEANEIEIKATGKLKLTGGKIELN